MHLVVQHLLSLIRRQRHLHAGDRVGVAVSGGIDSVALLRLLLEVRAELGIVLSVVHFNHKLRGAESDGDEEFVASLARAHELTFHVDSDDVAQQAREERVSVEAAARELRYEFFRSLIAEAPSGAEAQEKTGAVERSAGSRVLVNPYRGVLDKIVTGHTLDDQAETGLMRMIRGTGTRGLGGIHPRIAVEDDDGEICGAIVRPLLGIRRRELEEYLRSLGQGWREDSSNADDHFTRNRVRKLVVPLLEKEFNPAVAENLAELAEIARGEEDYWENEVAGWFGTTVQWEQPEWARVVSGEDRLVQIAASGGLTSPMQAKNDLRWRIESATWLVMNASISRVWFLAEPLAVQRRVVKSIGEHAGIPLEFKHVEEIVRFAAEEGSAGKELSLPLGWKVKLESEAVVFLTPDLRGCAVALDDYEYALVLPGQTVVPESGSIFDLHCVEFPRDTDQNARYNPNQLLDAESVPGPLRVRNWHPGDRFWPAHTKSPKKIKELLQERHIALPERKAWPVILCGDEIVWVRGFAVPAKLQAKSGRTAIAIVETSLDEAGGV